MSELPITIASQPDGRRGLVLGLAVHEETAIAVGGQGSDLILTSENGVTWKQGRGKGKGLRGALLRDDGLWVVGEWGYLASSTDLGKTWTKVATKTSGCLFGVVSDDEGQIWIAGDGGYLAVSKSGKTLTRVEGVDESIARIWNSPLGVLVPGDTPGYLYIAKGKAVTKTTAKAGTDLMSAVMTPAGTLITVGSKGVVLRSDDKGESFATIAVPTKVMLCAVECFEDGRVVIVGESGVVLLSNDDGKTFARVAHAAAGGTLWCCRRYKDVLLAGGEDGLVLTIGERSVAPSPSLSATPAEAEKPAAKKVSVEERPVAEPARPEWAAPPPSPQAQLWEPPPPLPVESKDGVGWSPALRNMLYPRRGGIATIVRPLPTLEEAWATLRRILWAADRFGMERKERRSGIWDFVSSGDKMRRAIGERLLDPAPRTGTFAEDAALVELGFEKYSGFIADFHEDMYEALADFLVVSVGLSEALRRAIAGLDDELPYVGVGPFGRLRELLAVASDADYAAARAAILASSAEAIAKDPTADRHIADLRWTTTFLLPLGPAAGDEERELHARALPNTVKFGDFGVHACGLAAGDLATLEHFLKKNGQTRHEFFSPFNGRMYLASVLEIAGSSAGPVLARMKPSDPWTKDAHHNGLWCQLIAHVSHPAILEALHREHRTDGYVWGTAGLVTAARLDAERVLGFAREKNDSALVALLEAEIARAPAPPRRNVPGAEIPEELLSPVSYVPPPVRRGVPLTSRVVLEPEATWRDEEREQAQERSGAHDEAVMWNGVSLLKASPEEAEAFIAHREKWAVPTSLEDLVLAPRALHDRLMALGFSIREYSARWTLPPVMLKGGLTHLPALRAALEEPEALEPAL
ncbi:MAG: Molybdate metabolism regulator, partial [Labilithrix sp.]|nr:Molybdate metabolism regulator [Labilithrix sp.]